MATKKKFYAVRRGRNLGVFSSWEECETSVKGYSGASFKGFSTEKEAKSWLESSSEATEDTNSRHVISDIYTARCPICGKPYQVITTMGGDQSACSKCVREGMQNTYGSGDDKWRDYLNSLPKSYS